MSNRAPQLTFRAIGGIASQVVSRLEADMMKARAERVDEAVREVERMNWKSRAKLNALRAKHGG